MFSLYLSRYPLADSRTPRLDGALAVVSSMTMEVEGARLHIQEHLTRKDLLDALLLLAVVSSVTKEVEAAKFLREVH